MEDAWKSFFCVVTSWMRRGFLYIQNKVSRGCSEQGGMLRGTLNTIIMLNKVSKG
jgi:hypothetical protein